MPELPEVEVIRRGLAKKLVGDKIIAVDLGRQRLRRQALDSELASLAGHTFSRLTRRGKYLLLHLDQGQTLLVHLGMTGRLLLQTNSCPLPPHVHLTLHCQSGHKLLYQDVRRFGQILLYPPGKRPPALEQVGWEPFSRGLTPEWLRQKMARLTRPVKNFLLDGRFIAGIGNIYASETLFEARVHPQTPVGRIDLKTWETLLRAIRRILRRAIKAGGTTIVNYVDCDGQSGLFSVQLKVYGRAGSPCPVCQTPITRLVMAGRSTFFCSTCQPINL
ncbi:bifunctional DNA-formamidopyrimidine glycosylase/DNA-(apurinic or apyrimidinic site) lyase [Desulfobacca acetoxidans]|nr:formamidopyrimidine-DNA glycosylase [Desulfobacterales bacterium]